ncbi:MAG: Xaa-Pro peptidase family protein [Puniceicoccales bacterium]|nr:Xaa-Pro peptidase family protein [Puniceicoccales bacterium]
MSPGAKLQFADSQNSSNMLYWSKIGVPDPFIAFEIEGKRTAVVNPLELENMRQNSSFDEIINIDDILGLGKNCDPAKVIKTIGVRYDVSSWSVPYNFPVGLWKKLEAEGVNLSICTRECFIEERTIKSSAEIDYIKEACEITAEGLALAQSIIADSTIASDGTLTSSGHRLTSDYVRREIEIGCAKNGAVAQNTIVSCGRHSAQPHNVGKGPLLANEFIVVDIFPRVRATGYHGDMTRTFIKGTPSDSQVNLYNAVKKSQASSVEMVKAGVLGSDIHANNLTLFSELGFSTDTATAEGFFHGTGHGLGLDIHEFPGVGNTKTVLQNGMVITLEPGLYYKDIGGVRLEDVVVVRETGCEMLSNFNYNWVL